MTWTVTTTRWTTALLAVALVTGPGGAEAQEREDTLTLTLADALALAEGRNPTYRQAVNELDLMGVESRRTWMDQVLPSPSLTLFSTGYTGNLRRRATDNFGNPIESPESRWVYFSNTQQRLDLGWSIRGSSIFDALDRQDQTNLERELAEDRALTEVRTEVRRLYFDALEQRDLLRAEERLAESRRLEQEMTERLFGLARASRVDVLNAELGIEQQDLTLQQQRAAFEQAKLTLRTQLGDPDLPPFRLADEALPVFDPSSLDVDRLVRRALDSNPGIREARASVQSARLGVDEANNAWWPELSFGVNVLRTAQTREAQALFDLSYDEGLESNFGISLSLPMFNNYFQNRVEIEQAEVALSNQREALRETRLQTDESVRSALLDLRNQHESLRLARRSAEIAREALELAREEYRLGTRTFEQLRESVDQEAETRRQVIEARHGFLDALLTLEEAVGVPVRGGSPAAADVEGPSGSRGGVEGR